MDSQIIWILFKNEYLILTKAYTIAVTQLRSKIDLTSIRDTDTIRFWNLQSLTIGLKWYVIVYKPIK